MAKLLEILRKFRPPTLPRVWSNFVALVLLIVCVGPAIASCLKAGSVTQDAVIRMVALATGLQLWFSKIPGSTSVPCPSCGAIIGEIFSLAKGEAQNETQTAQAAGAPPAVGLKREELLSTSLPAGDAPPARGALLPSLPPEEITLPAPPLSGPIVSRSTNTPLLPPPPVPVSKPQATPPKLPPRVTSKLPVKKS